ncbi:YiiX/YebB-like N1pC/P60 family cysteine hydrolase [Lutibacter sp.]|uniref:YiiX/YebB-like N1pC/P60 family cysteine hydrolase n=1 Tax=Lutibacter sp. TaxID=1925666 RepID=UPI0035631919
MKKQIKYITIGILLIAFLFLYQEEKIIVNENDKINIQQFDLILTSGQSLQSKLLNLFNFTRYSYSHIGLILKKNNEIYVLHSTPDGTKENGIRFDHFQQFIDLSNVNYYRILRLNTKDNYNLNRSLNRFKNKKVAFDYEFNNFDKNKIYCSELIFDIFNENGLIKTKIDLSKPIHPKIFAQMPEFSSIMDRNSNNNINQKIPK